ncbi:MAG TPA: ABC transporter permease, partial [Gemmatimonadales bacterium]
GIVMGSASLVAVLSLGDGLDHYVRGQIERTTDLQAISLTPELTRLMDGQRLYRSDTVHLDIAEARSILGGLPGVGGASLTLTGGAELGRAGATAPRAALVSAIWREGGSRADSVAHGRGFSDADLLGADSVALVSDTLARALGGGGEARRALGVPLMLNGHRFLIVGVLPRRPVGERPAVVVPFGAATIAMAPGVGPRTPSLVVTSEAVEGTGALHRALEQRLEQRYGPKQDRIRLTLNASRLAQVRQGMLVFKLVMGAITGISLLVGGVGIMNVLLAGVVERTREIGIRKAVGASRRDILTQFLSESVAIAGAGTLLGLVLGLAGAFGVSAVVRARSEAEVYAWFAWSSAAVAALSAVTVGLVFGCYPALRAARMSPIEAIRHE